MDGRPQAATVSNDYRYRLAKEQGLDPDADMLPGRSEYLRMVGYTPAIKAYVDRQSRKA